MFGPRLNGVFASRWKALWWAGSILLLAYCTVPAPDPETAPADRAAQAPHASPWDRKAD